VGVCPSEPQGWDVCAECLQVLSAILISESMAATISPRRGRSATGTAAVPPEERPGRTAHFAEVKRTSTGFLG
jgi:hypothetical protein